jgi:hypothetical protein
MDTHYFFISATPFKGHIAIKLGKQCIVTAHANVPAGVNAGPTLADDNAAGCHVLAVMAFHTKPFGSTVATIAGTTHAFLMCKQLEVKPHLSHPLMQNRKLI